jgi:aromatic amino acid aminotransferase I
VPRVGHFSEKETRENGVVITAGKHDLAEGKGLYDISAALNYGQGTGSAQLLRWCVEHTELVHHPPYSDWWCTMTIGSTSGLDMITRMFIHPNMCMLTEEYTFSTAAEAVTSMGVRMVGVEVDDEGMLPESLDHILTKWDPSQHNGSPKPFLVYTVPTGQNPTGATQSLPRRKALYAVAQKHDLLIISDEPYAYQTVLVTCNSNIMEMTISKLSPLPTSHYPFYTSPSSVRYPQSSKRINT